MGLQGSDIYLVADFRVFRTKTQLFEVVHRKKNYYEKLNSFDSGNPRNNGEETVLRVQIVVLSRRRVSGARTSQILIEATDFLEILEYFWEFNEKLQV